MYFVVAVAERRGEEEVHRGESQRAGQAVDIRPQLLLRRRGTYIPGCMHLISLPIQNYLFRSDPPGYFRSIFNQQALIASYFLDK
jgi:hypothetical protein